MTYRTDLRVVLYGDSNANLVDGSTIWLQSTALVLAGLGIDEVEVVLKAPIERDVVVAPLKRRDGLHLIEPDTFLTSAAAAHAVASREPDLVLVRGSAVSLEMAAIDGLQGRLWTYLTDIPQHPLVATPEQLDELERIIDGSEVLLCQTDALRGLLETLVPAACGRTATFPPMLPLDTMPHRRRVLSDGPVRLAYAGKFAPHWRTLEMTRLPERFASRGIDVEIDFIGDKIHAGPAGAAYRQQMRTALEDSAGVHWVGALSRDDTFSRLVEADFGLAWRDPALDVSLEVSTKLLEYGALGLPALLNRTDEHETLLGSDYPLFVGNETDHVAAVEACLEDPSLHELATARLATVARNHSFDAARMRLQRILDRKRPAARRPSPNKPTRVLVASHDLRFFSPIADFLAAVPSMDLRHDRWAELTRHDVEQSQRELNEADVIFCEWAGPNAVWYSRHKRPGQRLVVRLHRFELYRPWAEQLDIDAIDTVVCVNDRYRRLAIQRLGWPDDKVVTLPNFVDVLDLERPKAADATFRIGMIGVSSRRKRLDLGVEVLARLRGIDERFTMAVKTLMPWEVEWAWAQATERRAARDVHTRIASDLRLHEAIQFDGFGPDVGHWLRRVGWVLSTSDDESFHLATAEGMASGAVPVVRNWEGARDVYEDRWVHSSIDAMVTHIAEGAIDGTWSRLAQDAHEAAAQWDVTTVARQWEDLLLA